MQIQLIGLPASGKSTLSKMLVSNYPDLYESGIKQYISVKKLLTRRPLFFLSVLVRLLPILPICMVGVSRSDVNNFKKIEAIGGLFLNFANYLESKNIAIRREKVVIWDEMLLQRSLSIFAYSSSLPRIRIIKKYIGWATRVCECVPVIISCESDCKRLIGRGVPNRMTGIGLEQMEGLLKVQDKVLKILIEVLPGVEIIDTDDDVERSAERLHKFLFNTFHARESK